MHIHQSTSISQNWCSCWSSHHCSFIWFKTFKLNLNRNATFLAETESWFLVNQSWKLSSCSSERKAWNLQGVSQWEQKVLHKTPEMQHSVTPVFRWIRYFLNTMDPLVENFKFYCWLIHWKESQIELMWYFSVPIRNWKNAIMVSPLNWGVMINSDRTECWINLSFTLSQYVPDFGDTVNHCFSRGLSSKKNPW